MIKMLHVLFLGSLLFLMGCSTTITAYDNNQTHFITKFFPAEGSNKEDKKKYPLIFLFGGSEGGMIFNNIQETSDLQHLGYNVVSVGYFGMKGLPKDLNHINLNGFEKVLRQYKKHPKVDSNSIGVLGISKGGELVLLLASLYSDIHTVVAIVPSHVAFQASNVTLKSNSSWVYNDKEVPFVSFPRLSISTIKGVIDGEKYREMHIEALENKKAVEKARIKVENINGSIYLLSARYDHFWPSMEMSNEIMKRLKEKKFKHTYEHKTFNCNHYVLEQKGAWQGVLEFLKKEKGR